MRVDKSQRETIAIFRETLVRDLLVNLLHKILTIKKWSQR